METYQLSQPRLKCGEVFIWDCVGELFAIECQLCEERPLCTLSEFTEHMDVWHYDWTAEAYASLPDMPDTTTMSDDENSQLHWATASDIMYASSATPTERTYSLSGDDDDHDDEEDDNEFESFYYDGAEAKTVEEVEMDIETALENRPTSAQTNIVYDGNQSTATPSPTFDTAASLTKPLQDDVMLDVNDVYDASIEFSAAADANEVFGVSTAAAQNIDEELQANSTTTSLIAQKQVEVEVEPPAFQSLKTEKMIEIYEKFPELWHKQRNPMDTAAQTRAYKSISYELCQQGIKLKAHTVQRRIHALRKRYRLEKLKELKHVLEGCPYESRFEFYDQLQFLKHHIAPQLCKICNQICKDAAECCTRPPVTFTTEEQNTCDSEITESADEAQYAETVQMNEYLGGAELAKTDVQMQVQTEEALVTAGAMSFETLIANQTSVPALHSTGSDGNDLQHTPAMDAMETVTANSVDTRAIHCPGCDGNELQNPPVLPSIETIATNQVTVRAIHSPSYDGNELQKAPVLPSIETITTSKLAVRTIQSPSYDGNELQNSSAMGSMETTAANEVVVRPMHETGCVSGVLETLASLVSVPTAVSMSAYSVQQEMECLETAHMENTYTQLTTANFEPQVTPYLQHVVPGIAPPDCFIQHTDITNEQQKTLIAQHSLPQNVLQDANFVPHTVPAYGPQETQKPLDNRNKVEILEVLELPKMYLDAQEQEVTTSTAEGTYLKNIADENMAGEEYQSSNGDSGVLRDLDEQCNAEVKPTKGAKRNKHPTFARLSTEQARTLISVYENYPTLWDPKHSDYSIRDRRRKVWNQITTQINEAFKTRYTWTTVHRKMHDYMKYYRRERQRIAADGGQTRWFFYDDFAFLNRVIDEENSDVPKVLQSKIQNRKIIDVYKNYPQLWDTDHAEFKRRTLRQGLFREMSEKLLSTENISITALKLQQRIVEFRCTYRMEKERRCSAEKRGESYKPCYEYYEQLQFLDAHTSPFICVKCNAQFAKHGERARHVQREHGPKRKFDNPLPPPPVRTTMEKKVAALDNVCHICGNGFTLRRTLLCHLKRHNSPPKRVCSMCPKRFFDTHTLQIHERSHTKSRPFICEQCGASYASGSKLNQHLKRHNNQRDHPCSVCGKAFYSAFECERHMRTHVNIREKVCPVCGKDFAVGSSYYAHMLLHQDVKRYKCADCSMEFAQFAGLYKHRKRHHPAEFALEKARKTGEISEGNQAAQSLNAESLLADAEI